MLVLSREVGEKILIGKDVTLTVVSIEGNRIKLAIKAPLHTTVLREELQSASEAGAGHPARPLSISNPN